MEIDPSEKYLATGDVNGLVKIWNIADYCLNLDQNNANTDLVTIPRKLTRLLN